MHLPEFSYYEPGSLEEAAGYLQQYENGAIIAGGTDLVVALKQRLQKPSYLLSLDKIPALGGIREAGGYLSLGTMTTLEEIVDSSLVKEKFSALHKAAWEVGSPLLRAVATIGGNICLNTRCRFYNQSAFWRSSNDPCCKTGGTVCHVTGKRNNCDSAFSADIPPVLIAYGARIKLLGQRGERTIPLEDFYTGDGRYPNEILAGSREILTSVEIPLSAAEMKSTYHKFRLRDAIDFPLLGVAVAMAVNEKNICQQARLVFTGAGSAPLQSLYAGQMLPGKEITADLVAMVSEKAATEIHPLRTDLVSPHYKRRVAKNIICEAIMEAGGMR